MIFLRRTGDAKVSFIQHPISRPGPSRRLPGEHDWRLELDDGARLRGFFRPGTGRTAGVFVHGFRSHCDGGKSRGLSRTAGVQGRTWLRFDQRGCGLSDGDFREFTISGAVADLHRVLEALDEPPCILVGSSLGALISIHVASCARHQIEGLLLIAPAVRFTDRFIHGQLGARDLVQWRHRGYRWFADLYAGGCYRLDHAFCTDALRYGAAPTTVPCPVRVIHGDSDEVLPLDDTRRWLASLQCPSGAGDKALEIVPGGDHRLTQWIELIARQTEILWNEVSKPCV